MWTGEVERQYSDLNRLPTEVQWAEIVGQGVLKQSQRFRKTFEGLFGLGLLRFLGADSCSWSVRQLVVVRSERR